MKKFVFGAVIVMFACKGQSYNSVESNIHSISKTKKNILFIAVDDLKPLLSNYGEFQMITPNFERLAKMGMTFTNAHVQYAVCGPSRASIMTGVNPDKTKVWDLHTNFRESAPDLISMPEYLISQGYESSGVGKIYHKASSSSGHDGKSWSIPHELPNANGNPAFNTYQDPYVKLQMQGLIKEAKQKGYQHYGKLTKYVFQRLKPSNEASNVPDDYYQDGVYTITAIKQMKKMMVGHKPWFQAIGFQRPHLPFNAPKKYWDLYKREQIKIAQFQEVSEGTPKLAFHSFGELRSYTDIPNTISAGDTLPIEKQKELIHGYMACVSYIDAQIGKLLDFLEAKGALQNTVIVLWGDHGFHLGDHTQWCKHSNFEQATRIPLMFASPDIKKNQKSSDPVNLVDLFPTVFELANVPQSSQTDGKSLVPLLDNDASTTLENNYAHHQYARGNRMGYSIRTKQYRYTEWHGSNYKSYDTYKDGNIVGVELYDYEKDPLETKNLIDEQAYKSIKIDLKQKLKYHLTHGN